jgi:hypothetical protein
MIDLDAEWQRRVRLRPTCPAIFFPFSMGTTFFGGTYSATCSSPDSTQVILRQIDAVLFLQDAARPDARRHRVAAIDADALAFQILGRHECPPWCSPGMAP